MIYSYRSTFLIRHTHYILRIIFLSKLNVIGLDNMQNESDLINAATKGNREAQFRLGRMYRDGDSFEKNTTKAIKWLTLASDNGHERAKYELAEILYKSSSELDQLKSIKYCYELAMCGNKDAMFRLYLHYRYAIGTKKDMDIAIKWLNNSIAAGHNGAKKELESLNNTV